MATTTTSRHSHIDVLQEGKENVRVGAQAVRKAGQIAQGVSFADLHFTEYRPKEDGLKPNNKPGLTDVTKLSNHGYINKIRRDSVSGKPKEAKKVPLVRTNSKVSFKPAGRRSSVSEKKFTVPVPQHAVPDGNESPMDVDSPMVRIRSLMTRKPHGVLDIDAIKDPLTCSEYAQDVIDYLMVVERRFTYPEKYLQQKGAEVTPHMRTILMDWLIQVQVHQELSQHTLHLCVNLIDRFLCKQTVMLDTLQLLGITCLLISAKYHERFPPEIADLCHLTDGTYTPPQVLKMERFVLRKLEFNLNIPDPVVFVERFLLVNQCEKKVLIQSMSMYLLDLTLTEVAFVHFYPSLLAASAIYVSRELLACDEIWNPAFAHYTKYSEKDLDECVRALKRILSKLHKMKIVGAKQKYAHSDYHGISNHKALKPVELWPDPDQDDEEDEKTTFKSQETLIM